MSLAKADDVLRALAGPDAIKQRVLIVVAHPDDETLGLGAQLWRLRDAVLLHVTDGAPRDGADAAREGFACIADYAAARRRELAAALAAGNAGHLRTATFDIADQEAIGELGFVTRRLADRLVEERPNAVLTHAYEGGHPDHDAVAFAVQAACASLPPERQPTIIEFPLYHAENGMLCAGSFVEPRGRETVLELAPADAARKRRMVDCFTTQRDFISRFPLSVERFRAAPGYDFTAPPHPGTLLYETFGWQVTGELWRAQAAAVLDELGRARRECL